MKKLVLTTVGLSLAILFSAFNIGKHLPEGMHDMMQKHATHMTEMLSEKLELSTEQEAQLLKLNLAFADEMHTNAINEAFEFDKEKFKVRMENHHTSVKQILTADQVTKLEEFHAERESKMMAFMGEHKQMQEQMRDKMYPIMLEKRKEFEANLSDEEKAVIAEKRAHVKEKMEAGGMAQLQDMDRLDRMATKAEMMHNMAPLRDIAENHKSELKAVFMSMRSEMKGMHEQMKKEHGAEMQGLPREMMMQMMAIKFLLMDPAGEHTIIVSKEIPMSVYPNPATEHITVEYELKQKDAATINVLDNNGNLISSQTQPTQEAGKHTASIEINAPTVRDYFVVQITTSTGKATQKVFKVK